MNNPKNKRPSGAAGMSRRGTAESIKRIENELYFNTDSISVRLGRIEEKMENVATKEDMERFKTELMASLFSTFRWTIAVFILGAGLLLALLKIT